MKLMAFIVIAVMTYAVSVFHFVHQYATTTNVEQKKECRIGLTLFADYGILLRSYHKDSNVFRAKVYSRYCNSYKLTKHKARRCFSISGLCFVKNPIEEGEVYGYQEKYITIHIGYFPK